MDGAIDLAIPAFAAWTLVYHLNFLLDLRTTPLLVLWMLSMSGLGAGYVRLRRRFTTAPPTAETMLADGDAEQPDNDGLGRLTMSRAWAGTAIALGVAAGVTAGLPRSSVPWAVPVTLGLGAMILTGAALLTGRGPGKAAPPARFDTGSALALLIGAGLAILSLFAVNTDGDDAYFVSRSVWIGTHGLIPHGDVIFTNQAVGHVAGEVPVSSIEAWIGAMAHAFGISGASFTWYVFLPAATFGAVWALWRLIRQWAPRRPEACLVVAAVYLLWSGTSVYSFGSFHLIRMWQGKAVFLALLVPLSYAYLTKWAERRDRKALMLAMAAGICAVGLTSTAVLLMPLMIAAVVVPLLATGRVRIGLAAGGAAAYPVAAGLAVALVGNTMEVTGVLRPPGTAYAMVMLGGVMGAVAGCALWVGPWLARRGVPALIVAGIAGMATVLLVPGVLEVIGGLIPADAVLWRVPWIVPAPVLVGLIAAIRVPGGLRWPALAPALVMCAAIVLTGRPLWSAENGTSLATRPAWKADAESLAMARAALRANTGDGTLLAPFPVMRTVPLLNSDEHAVVANPHYLRNLPVDNTFKNDRRLLNTVATKSRSPSPTPERMRAALARVGVTYACVWWSDAKGHRLLSQAGFDHDTRIDRLRCLSP
jgi:hypothetical protein